MASSVEDKVNKVLSKHPNHKGYYVDQTIDGVTDDYPDAFIYTLFVIDTDDNGVETVYEYYYENRFQKGDALEPFVCYDSTEKKLFFEQHRRLSESYFH